MRIRLTTALSVIVLCLTACTLREDVARTDGTWVGTITTEGNVTTVVNESGSVWGGAATAVEEASIGLEAGADEYVFGEVSAVYATDEELYVLDRLASEVRVYDFSGDHLRSFGRAGQGPGEISSFASDLAVGPAGRIYVADAGNGRVNIYSAEGEPVDEISVSGQASFGRLRLVPADGGGVWIQVRVPDAEGESARYGVRVHTVDGTVGEPIFFPQVDHERRFVRVGGRDVEAVPFAADYTWALAYDGSVIAGASDRYRFHMIQPDGRSTIVERYWDPLPVTAHEADYWRRLTLAQFTGAEVSWNGENIPAHKPAYLGFWPAASGEIWLMRHGPLPAGACTIPPEELLASGDPILLAPCMFGEMIVDVFGRDGRYLGNVEGISLAGGTVPFIRGETVVMVAQDEAGTIMVKRYRLVLPGEE